MHFSMAVILPLVLATKTFATAYVAPPDSNGQIPINGVDVGSGSDMDHDIDVDYDVNVEQDTDYETAARTTMTSTIYSTITTVTPVQTLTLHGIHVVDAETTMKLTRTRMTITRTRVHTVTVPSPTYTKTLKGSPLSFTRPAVQTWYGGQKKTGCDKTACASCRYWYKCASGEPAW